MPPKSETFGGLDDDDDVAADTAVVDQAREFFATVDALPRCFGDTVVVAVVAVGRRTANAAVAVGAHPIARRRTTRRKAGLRRRRRKDGARVIVSACDRIKFQGDERPLEDDLRLQYSTVCNNIYNLFAHRGCRRLV